MPPIIIGLLALIVFAAVVLVVVSVAPMLTPKTNMRARLAGASAGGSAMAGPSLLQDSSRSLWARLVKEVERRGLSLKDTEGDALAEKLMLAGYSQPYAVRVFVLLKTALTVLLPVFAFVVMYLIGLPSPLRMYGVIVGAATVGLYLPNFLVGSKAAERKKSILNGFPDTLDLMLVCVEAGLGIDACFSRVGAEVTSSHPLLAELLAAVSLELRAGRTREVALRNFARRTALPEITAFVTLLNQSAKLGSSVGQALKIYATEMREARRMRAEEKAARLPVLLAVPLVLFLLPTMVSVLMLPAAISMKANLSSLGGK